MAETAPASQTLSRGIRILELLADAREPLTIDALAIRLGVHRSIAYRLLRTLEDHGLVVRDANGHVSLGARMAALAAGVAHDLQAEALPELTAAANELGMTCFLAILDHDECVTLASVELRDPTRRVREKCCIIERGRLECAAEPHVFDAQPAMDGRILVSLGRDVRD